MKVNLPLCQLSFPYETFWTNIWVIESKFRFSMPQHSLEQFIFYCSMADKKRMQDPAVKNRQKQHLKQSWQEKPILPSVWLYWHTRLSYGCPWNFDQITLLPWVQNVHFDDANVDCHVELPVCKVLRRGKEIVWGRPRVRLLRAKARYDHSYILLTLFKSFFF